MYISRAGAATNSGTRAGEDLVHHHTDEEGQGALIQAVAALQPDQFLVGSLQDIEVLFGQRRHRVDVMPADKHVDGNIEAGGLGGEINAAQLRVHDLKGFDEAPGVIDLVHQTVLGGQERHDGNREGEAWLAHVLIQNVQIGTVLGEHVRAGVGRRAIAARA